ncbi:MAG TPA: hypothetical protein VHZ28_17385 [Terracidiphilus sp.]|nr:hypothetical protein [Terracidiphilus sp.]
MTSASNLAATKSDLGLVANAEQRRNASLATAQRARQKQSLDLQRERILSQRTSNAGRRAALEAALKDIEAQLATLN